MEGGAGAACCLNGRAQEDRCRRLGRSPNDAMDTSPSELRPGLRILVAEDDDDYRALLVEKLQHAGHQVIEIEDGLELEDYLRLMLSGSIRRARPDLIITDVRMPGRSGIDVLREARQGRLACPVIVLSAFLDRDLRAEAGQIGNTVLLNKPTDLDVVVDLISVMAPADEG